MAEREIENIRERTLMGRESMAKAGKLVTGNPAYGFRYDSSIKQLRHDETEKPHALGIFNWVVQGKSIGSLVTNLNRLGILTRYGKPWTRQQMLKILRNPIYIGKAYWGKRERRNGRVVAKKRVEEGILIPVAPMVSEETFQKVQQQLDKNRSVSPRNTKLIYTLQHLLWCRGCGKRFLSRSHSNRHGKPLKTSQRYYGCQGMKQSPGAYHCRKSTELYAPAVEKVVWDKVTGAFADPDALVEILKVRNTAATEKAQVIKAELRAASDQLNKKQLELQQVLTWARQNLLTDDELKPQLAQVREQKQHWESETEKLHQKLNSLQVGSQRLLDVEQFCLSIRERMVNLTEQKKKEFLRLVVERIWVDERNNLEIEVIIPSFEKKHTDVICETALSFKGEGEEIFSLVCVYHSR